MLLAEDVFLTLGIRETLRKTYLHVTSILIDKRAFLALRIIHCD